eukprot:CAMPEP_0196587502 /NCGR_PEP_ID=MMETSP1081-20130531/57641_1 /TAXON_ID=36882 /ORGANISM="Pyramimonas amylifera, Strain CCMP720" /LENGTH=349 /DNA_ID=CAMNT_0041909699 /DNA_START=329 /DNA_END=1378 /DNA_ORIENTATION=+
MNIFTNIWNFASDFLKNLSPLEKEQDTAKTAEEYSKIMQEQMGSTLSYRHEEGINYNRITNNLIVGSCLQGPDDVDTILSKEGVSTILCLQEDKDMAWWKLDINPIIQRANELDGILHVREPVRDFDPFDLRMRLPAVVRNLHSELKRKRGSAYVHCTAGMGRAPAVALAHMWWLEEDPATGRPFTLDSAYKLLYGLRPCHPQLKSIRAATCDVIAGGVQMQPVFLHIKLDPSMETPKKVEISGLNVGWGNRVPLKFNPTTGEFELRTELPTGMFVYKFVVDDDIWLHSEDSPTSQEGDNVNNVIEVLPTTPESGPYKYLMADGAEITLEDREIIRNFMNAEPVTMAFK